MSADKWTTTLGRHIDQHIGRVSVDISTYISVDTSTDTYRSTYRPTLDRYVDRHIGRVSTDISVESRSICRPIHRSRGAQNTHDPAFFCPPLFIFYSERLDEALCVLHQNRELDESESEEEQTLW